MATTINDFGRATTVAMSGTLKFPDGEVATEDYTMWLTIKTKDDDSLTDDNAVLQKGFPVAINGLNTLSFTMELTPTETDIPENITYLYDFMLIGNTTQKRYPFGGVSRVKVLGNVTDKLINP